MYRPRIIPVLLLKKQALVKTKQFGKSTYIGDPINAVHIFNELMADELVFLDIDASREKRSISTQFVKKVGEEARMPFAVGGGINSISAIKSLLQAGAEKVVIGKEAATNPEFIRACTETYGSSSIVVCMDVKQTWSGKQKVCYLNANKIIPQDPVQYAQLIESMGAGEIIIQSVTRDGMRTGYDLPLLQSVALSVQIPIVALGGAGTIHHLIDTYHQVPVNGLAAGSLFVLKGNGVLITYPTNTRSLFSI